MGEYTNNLKLYKPDIGERNWGDKVNQNWDIIDSKLLSIDTAKSMFVRKSGDTVDYLHVRNELYTVINHVKIPVIFDYWFRLLKYSKFEPVCLFFSHYADPIYFDDEYHDDITVPNCVDNDLKLECIGIGIKTILGGCGIGLYSEGHKESGMILRDVNVSPPFVMFGIFDKRKLTDRRDLLYTDNGERGSVSGYIVYSDSNSKHLYAGNHLDLKPTNVIEPTTYCSPNYRFGFVYYVNKEYHELFVINHTGYMNSKYSNKVEIIYVKDIVFYTSDFAGDYGCFMFGLFNTVDKELFKAIVNGLFRMLLV